MGDKGSLRGGEACDERVWKEGGVGADSSDSSSK